MMTEAKWKVILRQQEGLYVGGGEHGFPYWTFLYRVEESRENAGGGLEHRERWEHDTFYVHDNPGSQAWHQVALAAAAQLLALSKAG